MRCPFVQSPCLVDEFQFRDRRSRGKLIHGAQSERAISFIAVRLVAIFDRLVEKHFRVLGDADEVCVVVGNDCRGIVAILVTRKELVIQFLADVLLWRYRDALFVVVLLSALYRSLIDLT